jgi:ribose 5-phosphate isomerase A
MKELTQSEQKILAARTAVDTLVKEGKIRSGMKIGLGTGSTAMPAVSRVADYIKDGTLKDIKAVVTSFQTANACQDLGIPVYSMNDRIIGGKLDLAIDGADEADPHCSLIKGGGAALLREKIVAYNAAQFVIVADSSKDVKTMGTKFALPVEIIGEARVPVTAALESLGAKCVLREGVRKCGPVITDNGNQILDCLWDHPVDPAEMEDRIDDITGVVEDGFFTKNRPVVFIAKADGSVEVRRPA